MAEDEVVHRTVPTGLTAEETELLLAVNRAKKPSPEQLEQLRALLDCYPGLARSIINVGDQVAEKIISGMVGHALTATALQHQAGELAASLAVRPDGSPSSPLELLQIQLIVLTWLRWQAAELAYQNFAGGTIPMADYHERRLSAAQRRYTAALESLARTRALLARVPMLQVNIARQQIVQNTGD